MKCVGHCLLKCFSKVLEAEWHFFIGKGSPWENESSFVLIFLFYLNLIITREPIHEGEYITPNTIIDDLINKRCQVVFLWTSLIQISEVSTYS